VVRLCGGLLYFTGILIMSYNLWRTARMPAIDSKVAAALAAPAPVAA
jgi:cytochrome c oxidase cbb3-type subunit 1